MVDDEITVLLQEAIAELQATRKQVEALAAQNKQMVEQNSDLTDRVKDMVEGQSRVGWKQSKRKVDVSVYTKVKYDVLYMYVCMLRVSRASQASLPWGSG